MDKPVILDDDSGEDEDGIIEIVSVSGQEKAPVLDLPAED